MPVASFSRDADFTRLTLGNYDELLGYSKTRALHRVDSIFDATLRILDEAEKHSINPNEAAMKVAEDRMQEIGDLRRFHLGGDDRNQQ